MNEIETAWAAGLYEGEGCVSVARSKGGYFPVMAVGMTDEDIVRRFHVMVGFGNVGVVTRPHGWKTIYKWQSAQFVPIQALLCQFWPYLGIRRRAQFGRVFGEIQRERQDLGRLTRWVKIERGRQVETCVNDHRFDDANTYVRVNGQRGCRVCDRAYGRRYRQKMRTIVLGLKEKEEVA